MKVGNKVVVSSGLVIFAAGLFWVSTGTPEMSYSVIAMQTVLLGGGMGLMSAPPTEAITGAVPKEKAGGGRPGRHPAAGASTGEHRSRLPADRRSSARTGGGRGVSHRLR